ncbi:MAG: hypothetical protein ILA26_07115 [Methanobrevibacter sp.]|uniref:DUF5750 family protein n=1 Tax=Methanobrevibacter sp. TaxID=66852 RepID=UPI001B427C15|nr:DUF5750 family protein [Methanobrevibacter sp.]MBP3791782.1 hypothetical protein [Methanobrevibacter sp.]
MIVNIIDYGNEGDKYFVEYKVDELSQDQLDFLKESLEEQTRIDDGSLFIKSYFDEDLYPFQSDVAKIRLDDFIAREEIEMNVFLSSFLEDM